MPFEELEPGTECTNISIDANDLVPCEIDPTEVAAVCEPVAAFPVSVQVLDAAAKSRAEAFTVFKGEGITDTMRLREAIDALVDVSTCEAQGARRYQ